MDLIVLHQANQRIINAIAKKLGLAQDKVFSNIKHFGNPSSSTIPLALIDVLQTLPLSYMNTVGNIAGPLLAYEVLTAFFLEATLLGIMLYGFGRVPGWLHTLATLLVAGGTTLSV